jgi:hypothetical protein
MIHLWEEGTRPPLWDRPYVQGKRLSAQPAVIAAFGFDNARYQPVLTVVIVGEDLER